MPTVKAKTTAKRRGRRRSTTPVIQNKGALERASEMYLVRDDKATHVVIPIDEYVRLSDAVEAQELAAMIEDKTVKWIDAGDLALELAGNYIAEARKQAGLTQSQLAARMGVPQSQISRIEKNPDRSTLRTMKRIAAALGMDISAMLRFAGRSR